MFSSYRGAPRRGGYQRGGFAQKSNDYEIKANRKYENSIFIGNLPYNVQWYELKDHFANAGPIVRADIVTNHGRPRGMGTVEYASRDVAQRAIDLYDRTLFMGREIFVREDLPPPEKKNDYRQQERFERQDRYDRSDRFDRRESNRYARGGRDTYTPAPSRREKDSFRREAAKGYEVFVGNLPFTVRWQDLKDLFREFGDIERADVMETSYGKSRGMGTVHFVNEQDAENAIAKLNNYEWFGRRIEVRPSKFPRAEENVSVSAPKIRTDGLSKNTDFTLGVTGDGDESETVFVGNLPWETAESDLFELFGSVATVEKAELQYGRGGRPSGNAVVKFADVNTALSVIDQLNGYEYGNRSLRISFAKYPSPEQLEALRREAGQSAEASNAQPEDVSSEIQEQQPVDSSSAQPTEQPADAPVQTSVEEAQPAEAADYGDEMIEE